MVTKEINNYTVFLFEKQTDFIRKHIEMITEDNPNYSFIYLNGNLEEKTILRYFRHMTTDLNWINDIRKNYNYIIAYRNRN